MSYFAIPDQLGKNANIENVLASSSSNIQEQSSAEQPTYIDKQDPQKSYYGLANKTLDGARQLTSPADLSAGKISLGGNNGNHLDCKIESSVSDIYMHFEDAETDDEIQIVREVTLSSKRPSPQPTKRKFFPTRENNLKRHNSTTMESHRKMTKKKRQKATTFWQQI